ncbi:MAG: MFS transporter [Gemmatimonadota bacterium]
MSTPLTSSVPPPRGTSLTRGDTNRALSSFITASGLWGVWGQCVGIGTAVFTGFVLHVGGDESYIALFTSIAYLLAAAQLFSPIIGRRIANQKRFVISSGFGEIAFRSCIALVPLVLAPALRLDAILVLVGLGLLCGHAISPFYSTWIANTVPEHSRARFTGRQTIISTVVAMVAGFAVGRFIDVYPEDHKQTGFTIVFAAGLVFGLLGYLALSRAPYPRKGRPEEGTPLGSGRLLLEPLRDGNFRRAVLFFGLWTFAMGLGGPLYSVFMLQRLQISYTTISVLNALFMATSIGGYRLWAGLVDRFGSKPVLQILMVPAIGVPLLWVFNEPGAYYLVPVALVASGILFSGIGVAVTPLLYGLVPPGERRPYYLASWSASVNLLGALGPLTGSFLVRYLKDVRVPLAGYELGNLQLIFALSSVAGLIPILLLQLVRDQSTVSSRRLLSNLLRGNFLSYTYNAAVYSMASGEERRARAALALGRSGSPLAIEQLIQALADASPVVRRSAARALGETGSEAASEHLVRVLIDGESDIRPEAAEALGRLGHRSGIDPLIEALTDEDPRVRISAIRGLWEIGGIEVQELLFWYFGDRFDPLTFPTLVDVLSHMGDHRVVKPTLQRLDQFRSPAVRLQLLNSVCRALGAGGEFYRLLSLEESRRSTTITRMLKRAATSLRRSAALEASVREELGAVSERIVKAYDSENLEWMAESVRQASGIIRDGLTADGRQPYEVLSVYLVILAIDDFLGGGGRDGLGAGEEIFLAVALQQITSLIRKLEAPRLEPDDE